MPLTVRADWEALKEPRSSTSFGSSTTQLLPLDGEGKQKAEIFTVGSPQHYLWQTINGAEEERTKTDLCKACSAQTRAWLVWASSFSGQ